jgi:hypothetical protein
MPTYEMIGIRFNLDKEDERLIFNSLTGKKATHIKKVLKQVFIGNGISYAKRSYIEEIISEYLLNKKIQFNTEIDQNKDEIETIDENELLLAALSSIKGV